MSVKNFKTVDEYIASQPAETQKTLLALRAVIRKAVPDATELFNYDIPAYALVQGGKRDKQIMIAGYKTFAGFYPGSGILEHFAKELADYKVGQDFRTVSQQSTLARKDNCCNHQVQTEDFD